mmetsp:Transcript_30348/g.33902  ORF Transcript_30348/g.33902 Transcript_30348/m.33902 type:complete len:134 (-) Transcript_30348:1099-1500(-)
MYYFGTVGRYVRKERAYEIKFDNGDVELVGLTTKNHTLAGSNKDRWCFKGEIDGVPGRKRKLDVNEPDDSDDSGDESDDYLAEDSGSEFEDDAYDDYVAPPPKKKSEDNYEPALYDRFTGFYISAQRGESVSF